MASESVNPHHSHHDHTRVSEYGSEDDRMIPPQDRICAFCNLGHAEGLEVRYANYQVLLYNSSSSSSSKTSSSGSRCCRRYLLPHMVYLNLFIFV